MASFGFGYTFSIGDLIFDQGYQQAFVRDHVTGEWYYVTTTISNFSGAALPADGSLDFFVLSDGVRPSDLAGEGGFAGASLITTAGLISNSEGDIIGVQTGFQTNLGYSWGETNTTVTPLSQATPEIANALEATLLGGMIGFGLGGPMGAAIGAAGATALWPLVRNLIRDPLVLDLDGDGIELTPLSGSSIHFDYDQDGFAERTGWVASDDGLLVIDRNEDGVVDGASELFGSPDQDGFAVLETYDSNGDGVIDVNDDAFGQLRVWRDLDQDGVSDTGELQTLDTAGIVSISLTRTDASGTNAGHTVGYEAEFQTGSGNGTAQTIYFETDRLQTVPDGTPTFTPEEGVEELPFIPGSGQIYSSAWLASEDEDFRTALEDLTDDAAALSPDALRGRFEQLLYQWAGVDEVNPLSRGEFVNAQHLAFLEKYAGQTYREIVEGQEAAGSPGRASFGDAIESSYQQIVSTLLTVFLSQTVASVAVRSGDLTVAMESPYLALSMLTFADPDPFDDHPAVQGNIEAVLELIVARVSGEPTGGGAEFLVRALMGLDGVASIWFDGIRGDYTDVAAPILAGLDSDDLEAVAASIIAGEAGYGSTESDGLVGNAEANLLAGGLGDDLLGGSGGSDIYLYASGDGTDYVRDDGAGTLDTDTLLLTDLNAEDVGFERIGDALVITTPTSTDKIIVEDYFANWTTERQGIDRVVFSDGEVFGREDIRALAVTVGNDGSNLLVDTSGDDVLHGGRGADLIRITGGDDRILYAEGDGEDVIEDNSGLATETDTLVLADLGISDVELTRAGSALLIKIIATGETIADVRFFEGLGGPETIGETWSTHHKGIDQLIFEGGTAWNRGIIFDQAWVRGSTFGEVIAGSSLDDTFLGGKGNDTLQGGYGADTYVWNKGDGSDVIADNASESDDDRLTLKNVHLSDVAFSRVGDGLRLTVISTGESILVSYQFAGVDNLFFGDGVGENRGIETLELANGVTLNRDQLAFRAGSASFGKAWDPTTIVVLDEEYNVITTAQYVTDEFGHVRNYFDAFVVYDRDYDASWGTSDIVLGGNGADEVDSNNLGGNYFDGRGGNDTLVGGSGEDVIIGGDGNDSLHGDLEYTIDASAVDAADYLEGNDGDDELYGGGGNDTLIGGSGSDTLNGGSGDDVLVDDSGGEGDTFVGGKGDDLIDMSGYDVFEGHVADGDDLVIYEEGDGNDVIFDYSPDTDEVDTLQLVDIDADDVELTHAGNSLLIRILATGDTITAVDFFVDWGSAANSIDEVQFDDAVWGREALALAAAYRGGDHRDVILGRMLLDETYTGGGGDDVIESSRNDAFDSDVDTGGDTFLYWEGDGNDIIYDRAISTTEVDRLKLMDIASTDVRLSRVGGDVRVQIVSTGETITLANFFSDFSEVAIGYGVDVIQFSDSVTWNRATIAANAWYRGNVTNDVLTGSGAAGETFWGGIGDDVMTSTREKWWLSVGQATGSDTWIYASGDGNDVMYDTSTSGAETDTLVLQGILRSGVELLRNGQDVVIEILATGELIRLGNFFQSANLSIDSISFSGGTTWDRDDISYWAQAGARTYGGTTGNDLIVGSDYDQVLSGNTGADVIDGKAGSNTINGDGGDDTIGISVADTGDTDELHGGSGTDSLTLVGFASAISADFVLNDGEIRTNDTGTADETGRLIATFDEFEKFYGSGFDDIIRGDAGGNTLVGNAGNDLLDGRSGSDSLEGGDGADTLVGYLGDDSLAGGAGHDSLNGGDGVDQLTGGTGNDTLAGGDGSDAYVYARGDGNDTLSEAVTSGSGALDKIVLHGVTPAQVTIEYDGDNMRIVIAESTSGGGDGGQITVINPAGSGTPDFDEFGIERVEFDNGTVWIASYLHVLSSPATDDYITGGWGSDTLEGGGGNDTMIGGQDGDTYIFSAGDGQDVIQDQGYYGTDAIVINGYTLGQATFSYAAWSDDLVITFAGSTDKITVLNTLASYPPDVIEEIRFGGTVVNGSQYRAYALANAKTTGNDLITGFTTSDTLEGGLGNDTLVGGQEGDTYLFAAGDGQDLVQDSGYYGTDALVITGYTLGQATFSYSAGTDDLIITFSGSSDQITLLNTLTNYPNDVFEEIRFGATTVSASQYRAYALAHAKTSGNDYIAGFTTADTLEGGQGNDTLIGGQEGDTYLFAAGDGHDVIQDAGYYGTDQVVISGIDSGDVVVTRQGIDSNTVELFVTGTSDQITIVNGFYWYPTDIVEQVVFTGGPTWSVTDLGNRLNIGGAGADLLHGSSSAETMTGNGGADTLYAGSGADTLVGGAAADDLYGGSGNDVFRYTDVAESTAAGRDRILDFAAGDLIKLDEIDADEVSGGEQAFILDADASFSTGEIRQTVVTGNLLVEANTDGDGDAEWSVLLVGRTSALTSSDFVL